MTLHQGVTISIFIGHSLLCTYAAGSYIVVQTPRCSDGSAGVHHQHRHVVRWVHICRSVGDSSKIVASLHLEAVRGKGRSITQCY